MDNLNLNDLLELIDQQKDAGEDVSACLTKAEALINVTLGCDFSDFPEKTIHDYLWALSDIIEKARTLQQASLDSLMKRAPVRLNPGTAA